MPGYAWLPEALVHGKQGIDSCRYPFTTPGSRETTVSKMPCLEAYVPGGTRTTNPTITSQECEPLHLGTLFSHSDYSGLDIARPSIYAGSALLFPTFWQAMSHMAILFPAQSDRKKRKIIFPVDIHKILPSTSIGSVVKVAKPDDMATLMITMNIWSLTNKQQQQNWGFDFQICNSMTCRFVIRHLYIF